MSAVSNSDILHAITNLTGELAAVKQIALDTRTQAKKTNGRVTRIEEWKNGLEAIDQYKKENPNPQINAPMAKTVIVKPRWFQNRQLATSAAAVLTAVSVAIGVVVGHYWGS